MKHLKGKWKRIKTQNKITFHIKNNIKFEFIKKMCYRVEFPKIPKERILFFV